MNITGFLAIYKDDVNGFLFKLIICLWLEILFLLRKSKLEMSASKISYHIFLNNLSFRTAIQYKPIFTFRGIIDSFRPQVDIRGIWLFMNMIIGGDVSVSINWSVLSLKSCSIVSQHKMRLFPIIIKDKQRESTPIQFLWDWWRFS